MKIMISVDDELLKKVDDYADQNYMSRSAVFQQGANQILRTDEMSRAIVNLSIAMQRVADTGEMDEKTRKEVEDMKALAAMFQSK